MGDIVDGIESTGQMNDVLNPIAVNIHDRWNFEKSFNREGQEPRSLILICKSPFETSMA
jgi:hypothetical protein